MNRNKRKIKLIERGFQIRLMVRFILINSLILSLFSFMLYLFFKGEIESNLNSAHVQYKSMQSMLGPIILIVTLFTLLLLALSLAWTILTASHRIAGPLYRIHQALKGMADRDLTINTHIRQSDQVQEISDQLTRFKSLLVSDFNRLSTELTEMQAQRGHDESLRPQIERMLAIVRSYQT